MIDLFTLGQTDKRTNDRPKAAALVDLPGCPATLRKLENNQRKSNHAEI